MKGKLLIDGKEIEVEISEEDYKRITEEKKTGYERVSVDDNFYYISAMGNIQSGDDNYTPVGNDYYDIGNYYSSKDVAENNARADKLMRQLRRFAVEHRENKIDWNDGHYKKYSIYYNHPDNSLDINYVVWNKTVGSILFDSEEAVQAAIDEFHDELIWYFTEYRDSL